MTKNFQVINLTQVVPAISMIGAAGIIEVTGTLGTATIEVVVTNDEVTIANNTALLALTGSNTSPVITNPVAAVDVAFNVQADRLTFRALTPDGATDITIRWFPVGTPY